MALTPRSQTYSRRRMPVGDSSFIAVFPAEDRVFARPQAATEQQRNRPWYHAPSTSDRSSRSHND